MEKKIEEFVNVSVRIRPVLVQDNTASSCLQIISNQPPVLFVLDRSQTYHFDNIFAEDIDQESVYNETVKPLAKYVKEGYNCTVFAYGQTGTGKTYTMGTNSPVHNSDRGLIPRTLDDFFSYENDEEIETDITVSFIEIYNEKVFDLLKNDNKVPLLVKGFNVHGVSREKVFNSYDAKHFLEIGNKNRHTAETRQNASSSRSHAIFTIYCNIRHSDRETTAKLNLVDLAGSESVGKTGNQGSTFQEGVNINKGLLCIGQVMSALSSANSTFIPYRQSIITTILQDSLNKKNFVSLIACINSSPDDCNETIQTLDFAQRVKRMKNRPEVNEVVTQYKKNNPALFISNRTGGTPFKRPSVTSFQTPSVKRPRIPLTTINEPQGSSTQVESPKSLFSMSVSTISTDISQQTLSPVIRKYITAMESSLMTRLESVIRDTLKRPSRESLLRKENGLKENKENTPSMSWNNIQNEVSKLVRNEIAQLTVQATRATSSPIDEFEKVKIRKVLQYDSPNSNAGVSENSPKDPDSAFKMPRLPIKKKKSKTRRTPSISPIENSEKSRRRSVRLSLKRKVGEPDSFEDSDSSLEYMSMAVSTKRRKENDISGIENVEMTVRKKLPRRSARFSALRSKGGSSDEFEAPVKRRCSVRLTQQKELKNNNVSSENLNFVKKNVNDKKNVLEERKSFVLKVLNKGRIKEVEKLHTIGQKTAERILLYRQVKGSIDQISDLLDMPGFGKKKYQKFLEDNFISEDC